ncbi:zinc finger MYM-type protein 2-like [Rhizophagus clarus]|uniref:Zinc finger MYM-type protein 2-like n=1 Tax=Rhizophagus clarus TaxID=94130 RepID=A0A8H3MAN3_9GLOM|nr:zinc finger MYM-type protein 2-like [Rhizophagus clarus]
MPYEKSKKNKTTEQKNNTNDVDFYREVNKVKNTHYATNNWIKSLENFRKKQGCDEKIEEINNVEKLDQQLAEFIASMKQKNGKEYATSSVKAAVAALYRYLNKNSIIKHINIYDTNIFTILSETVSGKIKYLSNLGYGEANGSNGLSFKEIQQILSHKFMDGSTPERLLRRVFFHNAIILKLGGGEYSSIEANNFKKRKDGGFDVYIYHSKTNQRRLSNDREKAEILIIPNQAEVINDYESYFAKRPVLADKQFYLQEYDEEKALQTGVWYKNSHIGEARLKGFMRDICRLTEIDLTNRISRDQMRLQSRHKTEKGLKPYELSRIGEQANMMSKMMMQIYGSKINLGNAYETDVENVKNSESSKSNINIVQNKINEPQGNYGFTTAREAMQVSKPLNESNVNKKASLPLQTSDKNLLEISIQPEQFFSLMQSGSLTNFNVKINGRAKTSPIATATLICLIVSTGVLKSNRKPICYSSISKIMFKSVKSRQRNNYRQFVSEELLIRQRLVAETNSNRC